jgi:hypothetical protein
MSPPPNETGGSANATRQKLLSETSIAAPPNKINGSQWRTWEIRAERLWEEFRRTRNENDFVAFVRQTAGMHARAMTADEPSLLALAEAALRKIGGSL